MKIENVRILILKTFFLGMFFGMLLFSMAFTIIPINNDFFLLIKNGKNPFYVLDMFLIIIVIIGIIFYRKRYF